MCRCDLCWCGSETVQCVGVTCAGVYMCKTPYRKTVCKYVYICLFVCIYVCATL